MKIQELIEKLKGILPKGDVRLIEADSSKPVDESTRGSDFLLPTENEVKEEKFNEKPLPAMLPFDVFFEQCHSLRRLRALVNGLEYLDETVTLQEALHPFRIFFTARWLRIQHSSVSYLRDRKHPVNDLCLQIAEVLSPFLNSSATKLVMPTIDLDPASLLHLHLLSQDGSRAISLVEYFEKAERIVSRLSPVKHEPLSFEDQAILGKHSSEVDAYVSAIEKRARFRVSGKINVAHFCDRLIRRFKSTRDRSEQQQAAKELQTVIAGLTEAQRTALFKCSTPHRKMNFKDVLESCGQSVLHYDCLDPMVPTQISVESLLQEIVDNNKELFQQALDIPQTLFDFVDHTLVEEVGVAKATFHQAVKSEKYTHHAVDQHSELARQVFTPAILNHLMINIGNEEIAQMQAMYGDALSHLLRDSHKGNEKQLKVFAEKLIEMLAAIPEANRTILVYWLGILPTLKAHGLHRILALLNPKQCKNFMKCLGRPALWSIFSKKEFLRYALGSLASDKRRDFFEWLQFNDVLLNMINEKDKENFQLLLRRFPEGEDRVAIALKLPLTKEVIHFILEMLDKREQAMFLKKLNDEQLRKIFVGDKKLPEFFAELLRTINFGLQTVFNQSHLQCYMRAYRCSLQAIVESAKSVSSPNFFNENAKLSQEYQEKIMRIKVEGKEAADALSAVSIFLAEMEGIYAPGAFLAYTQSNLSKNFDYLKGIYDFYQRLSQQSQPKTQPMVINEQRIK